MKEGFTKFKRGACLESFSSDVGAKAEASVNEAEAGTAW